MADQKITQLTADASPSGDDLIATVNDPSGTPVTRKVTLAALFGAGLDALLGQLQLAAPTELTIATGAITASKSRHLVDTEADAASDDLDTINGGAESAFLVISPANGARTVVVKHNTGNILCVGNADLTLDELHTFAILVYDSTAAKWFAQMGSISSGSGATVGEVKMWAGTPAAVPSGWLICDGSAVSRTTYASLFSAIGTVYGVGDGSTTFNLPDLRGKSPLGTNDAALPNGADGAYSTRNEGATGGEESHQLTTAELAQHNHGVTDPGHDHAAASGNFVRTGTGFSAASGTTNMGTSPTTATNTTGITTQNAGSDAAHNTMHPFQVLNFMIYSGV